MSPEDKTVLITGAAKRVGRSLALAMARSGWNVVIHYGASAKDAQSLAAEIRGLGRAAHLIQADLSDAEQTASIVPRALEFGPLDALVNNASIFDPLDWETTTLEAWNRNLMVNLTAPFLLSQAFARRLSPARRGRIVNLLDWRALRPGADHLPYTISKAALAALTQSLAQALAPQVTVNGLALGAILPANEGGGSNADVAAVAANYGAADDPLLANVPAGRWARLEEVEQGLLFFLTGPEYVTGEIIHIDGGRHLV
jgi:NAD(P)-dependent dehydrogenase (short-subunit alcohol dehydrogenase family)